MKYTGAFWLILTLSWLPLGRQPVSEKPYLEIGTTKIRLGSAAASVITDLQARFVVRPIEGGWEVRSRESDEGTPLVGISATSGVINRVSLRWGPGFTPRAETVGAQLAAGLPDAVECRVRNVSVQQEGGIVRTLRWDCRTHVLTMVTGTWPGGNTLTFDLDRK